jgi:diguanylate cyclase (GGDEF)-like protein/PAS domain S-box-containing protein
VAEARAVPAAASGMATVLVAESRAIRATAIAGFVAEAGHVVVGAEASPWGARAAAKTLRPSVVLVGIDDATTNWLGVLEEFAAGGAGVIAYSQQRLRRSEVDPLRYRARAVIRVPSGPTDVALAVAAGLAPPLRPEPSTVLVALGRLDAKGDLYQHMVGALSSSTGNGVTVRCSAYEFVPGEELLVDELEGQSGESGKLLVYGVRHRAGVVHVAHAEWVGPAPSRITARYIVPSKATPGPSTAAPAPARAPARPPAPSAGVLPGGTDVGAGLSAGARPALAAPPEFAIVRAFPSAALASGTDSGIVAVSERLARMLDRPADSIVGSAVTSVLAWRGDQTLLKPAGGERIAVRTEFEQVEVGGHGFTLWSFQPRADDAEPGDQDRDERTAREQLERRFRDLFDHLVVPLVRLDRDGQVVSANPAFAELLGFRDAGELVAQRWDPLDPSLGDAVRRLVLTGSGTVPEPRLEVRFRHRDGHAITSVVRVRRLDSRAAEEGAVELSVVEQDGAPPPGRLDALPRSAAVQDAIAAADGDVTLILVDLDLLSEVNDAFGFRVGDQILSATARRLAANVHPGDLLARLGGDQFAVVCRHGSGEATALARRIHLTMRDPVVVDDEPHTCTVSVGVATASSAAVTPVDLGRRAATAVREAKRRGRDQCRVAAHKPVPIRDSPGRTLADLRRALTDGSLTVVYQPIRSLLDSSVVGHEALIRWNHPERGVLGPSEFLTLADRSGLVVPIGALTLRRACEQLRVATEARPATMARSARAVMTVNVSLRQVADDGFLDDVAAIFTETRTSPEHITFDVVGTARLADDREVRQTLFELVAMGSGLVLERFESGHAPLELVHALPLTGLKLGEDLVHGLPTDERAALLLHSMVRMADDLGLGVGVVGIEREEQLQAVRAAKCRTAQGFLLGEPLTADELVGATT